MINIEDLINSFALNVRIIQLQTAGLSHEDSLIQPPYNGNCLNWVLGHFAISRDRVLTLLGAENLLTTEERLFYETGSDPVTPENPPLLTLGRLLELHATSQQIIEERLRNLTEAELARPMEGQEDPSSIGQRIFGLYFHETYHTGQTEQLRQLTGVNDQVI